MRACFAVRATALGSALASATILGLLAACATRTPSTPSDIAPPVEDRRVSLPSTPSPASAVGAPAHPRSRWVPATFAELPGWNNDRLLELWPALLQGCGSPVPAWNSICDEARRAAPRDDGEARRWIEQRLEVFRIESTDGSTSGLATGYFEPLIEARRRPSSDFRTPLWSLPAGLVARKAWWSRQDIDQHPRARAALRGREIAWVADPLDALLLQVQGSGRLRLKEADGSERTVRLTYAGTNEHPYRSVGRWLIDQGELKPTQASWPGIKDWARRNPGRVNELLWANPRVVFFREEALPDPAVGPRGAQGAPLTPGRSIAVDPSSVPFGSAIWLDTTEPLSSRPLQRMVMAQDTGSAITGAVRADYFWGWGEDAEAQAGRMKQPLRMWVLWPRG